MRSLITTMQAATIAGVMGLSLPLASAATAGGFASSTNPETGVTTTSVSNPDGTRTVTTSSNGDEEPTGDGVSDDEEPTSDGVSDYDEEYFEEWGEYPPRRSDWSDEFEDWDGESDVDDTPISPSNFLDYIPSAFFEGESAAYDAQEDWDFDNLGGDDEDDSEDTETGDNTGTEASETGDATGTFGASETGTDTGIFRETGTNAVRNAVSVAVNVGIRSVTHGVTPMAIHVAPPRVETPRPTVMLTAGPSRPFGTQ